MKLIDPPPADYAFAYEATPRSGNLINGLGEAEPRRATPVFHGSGKQQLDWSALDRFFVTINCWINVWHNLRNFWHLRNANGPVAESRLTVDDPAAMAEEVKQRALQFGAGIVGITEMTDSAVLDGSRAGYRYAICIGVPMDADEMRYVPQKRAGIAVMRSYVAGTKAVVGLAQHIRSLGWPARAYGLNCGICLEVCPWSESGRGPWLSETLLSKRDRGAGTSNQ